MACQRLLPSIIHNLHLRSSTLASSIVVGVCRTPRYHTIASHRKIIHNTPVTQWKIPSFFLLSPVLFLHLSAQLSKAKAKKGQKKIEVIVDPRDAADYIDLERILDDMRKVVEELKQDYVLNFRVGADIKLLDQLKVSLEGDHYQLREVAQITKKSEKAFILDFVSFPEALPAAQATIESSGLNLNPQVKGTKLEIAIPAVTTERRKTLAKAAKQRMNEAKDHIRKIRNQYEKQLQKVEHVPKDTDKAIRKQIGVYVDATCTESENIFKTKEKDLLLQQ